MYGTHSNFKPKHVGTAAKLLLLRSCKRSKTRIGHSDNRAKVSMIGHGVLFTEETLTVAKIRTHVYCLSFCKTCARTVRGHAPYSSTRKRIFANKQSKTVFFFFRTLLKDVFGLHKSSYVVFMKKIVSKFNVSMFCRYVHCYKTQKFNAMR